VTTLPNYSNTSCLTSAKQIGSDVDSLLNELHLLGRRILIPGRRYSSEEPILISPGNLHREIVNMTKDIYVIILPTTAAEIASVLASKYQQMLGKSDVSNETKSFIREKIMRRPLIL